jgi:UDP-2-acetamido-3-amino-2,3-dideoxy-glucuronate N-acetyltransferase
MENLRQARNDAWIHETAVVDEGCMVGDGTRVWHFAHLMTGCRVGRNCTIGQNVMVGADVVLGDQVKVQNNVSIYTGVTCEDDVFLGPSCVFTNVINPRSALSRKHQFLPTKVCKGASIGANATIICGNVIGEYAMIGAGAVVTKDVPAYALVIGNPARQVGWVSEYGHRLLFDENNIAVCPESNVKYTLKAGYVVIATLK